MLVGGQCAVLRTLQVGQYQTACSEQFRQGTDIGLCATPVDTTVHYCCFMEQYNELGLELKSLQLGLE